MPPASQNGWHCFKPVQTSHRTILPLLQEPLVAVLCCIASNKPICRDCADLFQWLEGKGLAEGLSVHSLEAAFTDGRLLCRLVSLLERRTLPGIEWRQPSPAAAQHNISKVGSRLDLLKSMACVTPAQVIHPWPVQLMTDSLCMADMPLSCSAGNG